MEETNRRQTVFGYSIITFAIFTWSIVEIIVKILQGSIGPIALSFFRYFIGGLFLLVVLILKKDLSGIWMMIKRNWFLFLFIAVFASSFSNILYFTGVTYTQANIASVILTTYPIWITIFSFFILKERSNLPFKLIGIMIGLIGVIILITNFNFTGFFDQQFLFGNVLVLCGSIIWSFYTPLGKRIQNRETETSNQALKFTMLSFLFASSCIFIIMLFTPEIKTFFVYNLTSWFWILVLGVVSTGLGQYIFFIGTKNIEISKGISLAFLKPIFATTLAFFILQEQPTIALFISIALVSFSVILINRNPKPNMSIDK